MEITPESVAAAVTSVASARGKGTLPNSMAFGRALKELGVKVSLSQVIDASRSIDLVDIAEKTDFRALLRANLISQKEDFPAFDMLFDCFWREQSYERVPMETMEIQGTPDRIASARRRRRRGRLGRGRYRKHRQGKCAAGKFRRVFRADL